nr:hypothetical protein [Streptomyces sp. SID13726]
MAGCGVGTGDDDAGGEGTRAATSAVGTATSAVSSAVSASAAGTPSPTEPASPSPGASASASATPTPAPVTGPDQKLVTMTVTGGFAGVDRRVVLRGDGTARVTDKGRSVVRRTDAARFRELRTLLGDPALDDVPAFSMHAGGADMFQYTLTFDGRTVMTDRAGDESALDRLIAALSELLPRS